MWGGAECDKHDMKDARVHQEDEAAGGLVQCRCLEIVFLHGRGTRGRVAILFLTAQLSEGT